MNISRRLTEMEHSPIRNLIPYALAAEKKGVKVIYGNIGQPDLSTPQVYKDGIEKFLNDKKKSDVIAYGPSEGLPGFREAYARYLKRHEISIEKEDIFTTFAGSEALLFILLAICDPGDEIIIPEPFYTNYRTFCTMAGVSIVPLTLSMKDGYSLPSMSVLEDLITEKTRAILLCTPNNPTGTTYTEKELSMIHKLCVHRNLWMVSDEVYREFVFDRQPFSALQLKDARTHTIVIDSLSKRYSLCGARVGVIVCRDRNLLHHILKMAQARLCPTTVGQIAAIELLDQCDGEIEKMRDIYRQRVDTLCKVLQNIPGVVIHKPQGAFYVMVKIPVDDSHVFAQYMVSSVEVDHETLLVAPASGFYMTDGLGKDEIRIAAVINEHSLRSAAKILRKALETYPNKKRSVHNEKN